MDDQHSDLLDRARALAIAKALIEREIQMLFREAFEAGVNRSVLARNLGVDRATVYRRCPDQTS